MARQSRALKAEHATGGTRRDPAAALKTDCAAKETGCALQQDDRLPGREAPRNRAPSEQAMADRARRLRLELARRDELDRHARLAANAVWLERLRDSAVDHAIGPKRSRNINEIATEALQRPSCDRPVPRLPLAVRAGKNDGAGSADGGPAADCPAPAPIGTAHYSGEARLAERGLHRPPCAGPSVTPDSGPAKRRQVRALPKWRLERVADYVDNNLAAKISLSDLAAVAGLSRMHFACQFRVATSLRPHEFVLQRRVQRAEELLRDTSYGILEIALTVGFETQAHFATVFRRFTGCTPRLWRTSNAGCRHLARDPAARAPYA